MRGEKRKKVKKQKQKRKKKVGDRKVVAGAEGALTEGCRKRKVEICSVRKDGVAGVYWPADAGMEGV